MTTSSAYTVTNGYGFAPYSITIKDSCTPCTGGIINWNDVQSMPAVGQKIKTKPKKTVPHVDRVIYNNPATIVFWSDDTKTVVKCAPDTEFNAYAGFCAAVAKKIFETNNGVRRAAGLPKEKRLNLDNKEKES